MIRLPAFRPRLLEMYGEYTAARLRADILSGITVGILALPLAIAFAIASGMTPESGIYTAIIAGFIISALGATAILDATLDDAVATTACRALKIVIS